MNKKIRMPFLTALTLAYTACLNVAQAASVLNTEKETIVHNQLRKLSQHQVAIHVGGKVFTVDLYDNPTARDMINRLPFTLTVNKYPGYDEKMIRLPKGLSMEGAPHGDEPEIPEVGYYEPGQWIAIYYGPIGYWLGKVPLGRIHASISELRDIPDDAPITIELTQ